MLIRSPAILCSVLPHGEHGAIARALTPDHGLLAGYVRGGRSRRLRPVLMAGNSLETEYRARTEGQLPALVVELIHSRGALLDEPLPAAAIDWLCALTAVALPEAQPFPNIFAALEGVLAAIEYAPAARGWVSGVVRYELLLMAELGFGLDLSACAATGSRDDLVFVSPKSGAAVSRAAGAPYAGRLLPLPAFLRTGQGDGDWGEIIDGFRLTGHFLRRDILNDRRIDPWPARQRLIDRIERLLG